MLCYTLYSALISSPFLLRLYSMIAQVMDIVTGTAGNTISSAIIVPVIQQVMRQIEDVRSLDENRRLLEEQLNRMERILLDINAQFRDPQRQAPVSLNNSLLRMQHEVEKGRHLIHRSQRALRCTDCLLRKPKVSTEIREWKTTLNGLFVELNTDFSLLCSAQQIASAAPHQQNVLLQDQPDTGLVGLEIKEAEIQLERWLKEASHVCIIAVWGMGGAGKTTLLKKVYNTFVGQVSDRIFDHVIWVTVSQFPILELQGRIASAINLDLSQCSSNDVDMRKMKLSAHLKTKRVFLVLDDMWSLLNLKELGVEFGTAKGSKLVFATRNRDLIQEMNAEESLQLQPLGTEEAWDLFCRIAFKDGHVPEDIKQIAREVASECKGLPLAINVIASTMIANTSINQWQFALRQMQTVDLNFPITHPRIDRDLYQRLRWSYDCLPNADFKNCFLYCAMFEEDAEIEMKRLVQMWISEGLVKTNNRDYDYLLQTGQSVVKLLENRSLFQVGHKRHMGQYVRVHDVLRDMAIYIGEKEEKCVFRAGLSLLQFPDIEAQDDCKRISVLSNGITWLPTQEELRCSQLVALFLGNNHLYRVIPEAFLVNFISLRVLDLSNTSLNSLPTSMCELIQLEFLDLSGNSISIIPDDIGNLFHLQYLYLNNCPYLTSLSNEIGKLKSLKYLDIRFTLIASIPREIEMLSKCKIVKRF